MKVRAIYTIQYSATPKLVPTGKLGPDGETLFSLKADIHKPGSVFEITETSVGQRLLESGAIEVLDEGFDEMIEAAAEVFLAERVGPPPKAAQPEKWPKPAFENRTLSRGSEADDFF